MYEKPVEPQTEATQAAAGQTAEEAWKEVGQQFRTLGESLAEAFRTAWDNPQTQQHFMEMKTGIEAMVTEVSQVMKETSASSEAHSPEAQQARSEAAKAFESARAAGEQAYQESRPHLLAALHELNEALKKWIERLEQRPPAKETGSEVQDAETGDKGWK